LDEHLGDQEEDRSRNWKNGSEKLAECVSCGKSIPAGKFFCDECYKSMKGRRATPHKVDAPASPKPKKESRASRKAKAAPPTSSPGTASSAEQAEPGPPTAAEDEEQAKKLSANLTPSDGKKVVSLKPKVEGVAGERSIGGKKRFKVTITFSERTYNAFARLKRKKKVEAATMEGEQEESESQPAKPRRMKRRGGPHGRPKLKAVSNQSEKKGGSENTFMRYIGYREREWDKGDKVAALMATILMVLIIVLCFLSWVKVTWSAGEASQPMSATVKGVGLGAPVYAMIAAVVAAWAYMAFSSFTGRTLLNLDFGFVIIMCGIILIALFFVAVGSTDRVMGAAAKSIGRGESFFKTSVSSFERQTLWTAYFTVFLGILFAFSGLARLSERKASKEPEKESE
jgi:preprotein translocase subunit SecG